MLSAEELWNVIEPLVKERGLELFDVDAPRSLKGTLRVFVAGHGGDTRGVRLEDCASVSKGISGLPNFEEICPGECLLEVSSPGVNRRLRRPEHFERAIGERVKVVTHDFPAVKGGVVRGKLIQFDGTAVALEDERTQERVSVPLLHVKDVHVDFLFE